MLQKTRKIQECDMGKYGTLDSREKTIAILGDRWPQTAIWEGDKISKKFPCTYGKNVVRAQTLEVSLLGVGTVLRLKKGCVVNGQMTKASN